MAERTFNGYRLTVSFYTDKACTKAMEEKVDGKSVNLERSFINNADTHLSYKTDDDKSVDYGWANLSRLDYTKQLYKPNCIHATLEFSSDLKSKIFALAKLFSNAKVNLDVVEILEKEGKEGTSYDALGSVYDVAEDYIVYEASPRYDSARGRKLYLELVICSPDKALDTIEYSKTYTARKLGEDILPSEVKLLMPSAPLKVDTDSMRILKYSEANGDQVVKKEFTIPYLVQYNETFYSFLARTAGRYGEFLYYEDGSLNLGAKLTENKVSEKDFDKVSLCAKKTDDSDSLSEYSYNNYLNKDDQLPTKSFVRAGELPGDEYIETVKKDSFASWGDEIKYVGSGLPELLGTLFTNTMGAGLFSSVVGIAQQLLFTSRGIANDINSKYNNKYFKDSKEETLSLYSGPEGKSELQEGNINIGARFNSLVRELELDSTRGLMELQITSNIGKEVKIGDVLSFEGADVKYVVIEVKGSFEVIMDKGGSRICQPINVVAAPMVQKTGVDKKNYFLPVPPCIVEPVRRVGSQKAFVSDIDDPKTLGRVRVRFCWQKKDTDQSPWIRVAVPLANSKGASASFKPAVGDNVLIDFENGNVEMPYVSGFLPTVKQQDFKGRHISPNSSVMISSENGQMLKMTDEDPSFNLLGLITQGIGTLLPGLPSVSDDDRKRYYGSTEFTDYYGLYSLKMSSSDKSITVNSPFGTVGINAFTGISINAPNGDIKISGKNVSIEAQNNISIYSGTYEEDLSFRWMADAVLGGAADFLMKYEEKFIGLEYLRNIIEIFIRPAEGTLSLKSGRYLTLQAGGAAAGVPCTGFVIPKGTVVDQESRGKVAELLQELLSIDGLVNTLAYDIKTVMDTLNKINDAWIDDFTYLDDAKNDLQLVLNGLTLKNIVDDGNSDGEFKEYKAAEGEDGEGIKYSEAFKEMATGISRASLREIESDIAMDLYNIAYDSPALATLVEKANGFVKMLREARKSLHCKYVVSENNDITFELDEKAPEEYMSRYKFSDGMESLQSVIKNSIPKFMEKNPNVVKGTRRLLAVELLKLAESPLKIKGVSKPAAGCEYNEQFAYQSKDDDDAWKKYVGSVFSDVKKGRWQSLKESAINAGKGLLDRINPIAAKTGKSQQGWRKWDAEKKGQILMSDTAGVTLYFNNGELQKFYNSDIYEVRFFCWHRL